MTLIRPTPLVLRSLIVLLGLGAALSGCPSKKEGGLLLKVILEAPVRADCVLVTITDNGRVRTRSVVARLPMKNEYFVGVARSDFPASLTFQASAIQGNCKDETDWKLASRSAEKTQAFPASGVEQFELTIGQPDTSLDADRDTYVDLGKGGTDCNDMDSMVNPGALQACASSVDTNCNGKLFCNDATCANTATCLRPATGLAFETMLPTLVAFDCSGSVAVQSVAGGMPAAVTSDTTVTLTPTGTASVGVQFFSDATCRTPLVGSTLPLPFGTTRATFSFRAPTAGALTITASAPTLGSTALNTIITDRPVASLSLTPMTLTSRAGACSSAVRVTALDDRMMPTNVPGAGLPLAVGFLPPGTSSVTTFTDANCMTAGVPSISAGTSSTQLYLRATRVTDAGMPITVQLSSPTVNGGLPGSLELTVTAGDAERIEFTATVLGLRNAACSVVMAEVELRDANGNITTAGPGGVNVALSYTPPGAGGTLEFFSAAACTGTATTAVTIPANTSRVGVFLRANGPGTYGVTATASVLPMPTAQLQADVATMDPSALVFPNPSARVSAGAGTCSSGLRLQTREMNSTTSPVSPVPANVVVTLSPVPAGAATLYSDANCMTALTNNQLTLNAGSSEVTFYFRSTIARDFTVSASATGLSTTSPAQLARVTPAPTSKLVFQPPTAVSALADGCSGGLGLVAFDTFDNPTYANGTITPSATPSVVVPAGVAFSTSGTCGTSATTVVMADGGATFFAKAQRAQQYSISATGISSSTTLAATFTVDAGPPSTLRVLTQPPSMVSAGAAGCAPVQVERLDGFMNPSPGAAQSYTVAVTTAGTASVHGDAASCASGVAGPALTFLAGETRATFFIRGRLAGTTAFTITASGMVTTLNTLVSPSNAALLRFATGSPQASSSVGACAQATVERVDSEGNITTLPTNLTVTVAATGPGSAGGLRLNSGGACTTAQASAAVSFSTATSATFSYDARTPGPLNFDVTSNGLTPAAGSTLVGAGAVARVRFVSPPTTDQGFNTCVPLTLEALDVGGNPVTSATGVMVSASTAGTFYTSIDCSTGVTSSVTVPGGSQQAFRYRPAALGAVTLTATPMMGMPDTAVFTVVPGVEASLLRTNFTPSTTAGACVNFTVRRVDSGSNDAVGALRTVTVTLTGPASMAPREAQIFAGAGCMGTSEPNPASVDIPSMMSTATFSVRVHKLGSLTLASTSNPLTAPANTTTTVVAGALSAITFVTTPPASLTANTCSPIVTVNGTDSEGNPSALGIQALAMANGSFSSASDCTTPIANLVAGTATTANFYLRNSAAGPAVVLTVGTAPSQTQNWVIDPPPVTALRFKAPAPTALTRFSCSGPYRIESTDGSAPVNSGVNRTITFGGAGLQYFSDSMCATAITTTSLASASSETVDFWVVALGTSSATLTADAAPALTQATAPVTITGTAGALKLVAFQASQHLEYRGCVSMTVERQVGVSTPVTGFATQLNLTRSGAAGPTATTYHLSTTCADAAVTTATINPGQSLVTLYVQGHSAAPTGATTAATATLTATDAFAGGFGNDNEVFTVYPAVRRGSCAIAGGQTSSNTGGSTPCSIGLALPPTSGVRDRSFFTFQVSMGTLTGSNDQNVTCELNATPTVIDCSRVGNSSDIAIEWQLVSFGSGVAVKHLNKTLATGSQDDIVLSPTIARAGTFFLASYSSTSPQLDWNDFPAMELLGPSSMPYDKLRIRNGTASLQVPFVLNAQVVTWTGLAVESGITTNNGTNSWAGTANTAASPSMAMLYTNRISADPGSNQGAICRYRIRGSLSSGTPQFSRGSGSMGNCVDTTMGETVWYRLGFPVAVGAVSSQPNLAITGSAATGTWNLGRLVPADRTWSFLGGQGPGGQSGGETNRNGNNEENLGYSVARITMADVSTNTIVTLTRGATGDNSNFAPFLVVLTE